MDPQATLERYLAAFADGPDLFEMEEAARDYNAWIARGGFPAKILDGRVVWGLSSNWNEGEPASPVGHPRGVSLPDTFVKASVLALLVKP